MIKNILDLIKKLSSKIKENFQKYIYGQIINLKPEGSTPFKGMLII
jgi:hypothetical protein